MTEVEDEAFLRTLIDLTWMRAVEHQEVPSSGIQTWLIERTRKAQSRVQPKPATAEPVWRHGDLVMTWREVIIDHGKNKGRACPDLLRLYVGEIYAGCVTKGDFTPWEALISTEHEKHLGDFDTKESAQSALIKAAVKALMGDAHG